ncbi:MAG: T9SS type A sorting domain-containing protein [Chloroherpetonaceae bacterium]|nr:T9SS type A sorting domain-containing protein [Chloroherpetonaceae bacterium]
MKIVVFIVSLHLGVSSALAQFTTGQAANVVLGQGGFTAGSTNGLDGAGFISPSGVAVDSVSGKVFVADAGNHRVLRFTSAAAMMTGSAAEAVFGQPNLFSNTPNNGGLSASTMSNPSGVAVDGSGNLYVADQNNHRVLRFASAATALTGAAATVALGQPDFVSAIANNGGLSASTMSNPFGVAVDGSGNLYVADLSNSRVLRFASASTALTGAAATVALGQPNLTSGTANNGGRSASTMNIPSGVAVDGSGNLYVADRGNNRVLRFASAATALTGAAANVVLGQGVFTAGVANLLDGAGFSAPSGVAVDPVSGKIFVADAGNHRVLRFTSAAAMVTGSAAEAAFGQPDLFSNTANNGGLSASTMSIPSGVAVDGSGNLYVADYNNHRVLRFASAATALTGAAAAVALGQPDLVSGTANNGGLSASTMNFPYGVAVDGSGNLYVADFSNNRVLRFASAATALTSAAATVALGQPNLTSGTANNGGLSASTMSSPSGVAVDGSGNLYVADRGNNRVLRFASAATALTGAAAAVALGQPDLVSGTANNGGLSASTMRFPHGVAVDGSSNLYVADQNNHRVLRFASASTALTGAAATVALGQPNLTSGTANNGGRSASTMNGPYGVAVDVSGNLYVADFSNHRVLRFNNITDYTGSPSSITPGSFNNVTFTMNGLLSAGITVNGTLTLEPGISVDLNSNTIQIVNPAASAILGSGSVSGSGSLIRAFNGDNTYSFPYLNGSDNRSASVAFTSGTGSGTLSFSYFNFSAGITGLPLTLVGQEVSTVAPFYWQITSSGSPGTYTLTLNSNNMLGVTNLSTLRIAKRLVSGSWSDVGIGTGVANSGTVLSPILTQIGMTGFGEFAISGNVVDNPLPVELLSFKAKATGDGAKLEWKTASEFENTGYSIYRDEILLASFSTHSSLKGKGTTTNAGEYTFIDSTAVYEKTYRYQLKDVSFSGRVTAHEPVTLKIDVMPRPKVYALGQNYPNPFNPSTTIGYQLPVAGAVSLKVYDVLGREVSTLVNASQAAGSYQANFNASNVSSGIYFYRLEVSSASSQVNLFVQTKKMVLVK